MMDYQPMLATLGKGSGAAASLAVAASADWVAWLDIHAKLGITLAGCASGLLFALSLALDIRKKWRDRNK